MRHEIPQGDLAAATEAAARGAVEADRDTAFPAQALRALHALGCTARPPVEEARVSALLALLAAIGRGDLSVGRIVEGHANALLLIRRFGTPAQRARHEAEAAAGALFGVWNTDVPDRPLRLQDGRLDGAKSFATGVDGLAAAIVTVETPAGRQMLLVPLRGVSVDRAWWRPLGMRASGSHVADFSGLAVDEQWLLGGPGDYLAEPAFSAGAIRFAAVHVGGAHGVLDAAAMHLRRVGRDADPYQLHRLARMGIAVETAYRWLDVGAEAWRAAHAPGAAPEAAGRAVAAANAMRAAVERVAMEVLEEAERGVGAAGMIAPHPLERRLRDLRTYLRQPNPDGALAALGTAIAEGVWTPGGASGKLPR